MLAAAPQFAAAGYALVFMGYGELLEEINLKKISNDNIYFHPAVPPDELLSYTQSADVGFSWIVDRCVSYYLCLPNKMFEYIMARVPVIASGLPEMERVISGSGCGVCLEEWTPASLASALSQIDALREGDLDLDLDVAAVQYCWENEEKKLVAAYESHVVSPERLPILIGGHERR